jgi:hypothetical protein
MNTDWSGSAVSARDLLGSAASPVTLSTGYGAPSSGFSTGGARWVVFYVFVDSASLASQIDIRVEASDVGAQWSPLTTETITVGAAPQSDYEPQRAFTGTGLILVLPVPVRGVPWLRVDAKADAGTPTVHIRYSLGA